jgi:hypothetical protein
LRKEEEQEEGEGMYFIEFTKPSARLEQGSHTSDFLTIGLISVKGKVLYHAERAYFPMYATQAPKIKIDHAEPRFCQDLRRLHSRFKLADNTPSCAFGRSC